MCDPPAMPAHPDDAPTRRPASRYTVATPKAGSGNAQTIAKKVVAERPTVLGNRSQVEVTFRFTLSREVMEKLTAQAIREARTVQAIVAEIIEKSQR